MIVDYLLLCIYAILGVQLFYFLFFFLRLALYKSQAPTGVTRPVSVVVCAHDEEQNLLELIPLLLKQQYHDFEVIVVNDRSNDGTYDLIREYATAHTRFKAVQIDHVPDHIQGKKFGLTMGIKAAKNDCILLTDADCRPASDQWISEMAAAYKEDTQIVLGYSPYEKRGGLLNLFIRFETLMTGVQYLSYALAGLPYMGVGRNLSYSKELFLSKKGFNQFRHVVGGDDDLFVNHHANRRNTDITIGKESLVFSSPKTNLSDYYRQKKRHLHVGKYYRGVHRFLLGLYALSHLLFWVAFIILAILEYKILWIWGIPVARWLVMIAVLFPAKRRIGDESKAWEWIIGDLMYLPYHAIAGVIALVTKKVRWN